jgi:hypothetical protein
MEAENRIRVLLAWRQRELWQQILEQLQQQSNVQASLIESSTLSMAV